MEQIILVTISILFIGFLFKINKNEGGKKNKTLLSIILFIILFIFAGFRDVTIGNDSMAYSLAYESIGNTTGIDPNLLRFEIGYRYFTEFLYKTSKSPLFLFIVTSFFIQLVNVRFYAKYTNIIGLSIFLFICFRFYFFSVSGIRQAIALLFILLSYDQLIKRKFPFFVFFVFLATLFHYSAIIFVFAYIFNYFKVNTKNVLKFILISSILLFSLNSLLLVFAWYTSYGKDYFDDPTGSLLGNGLISSTYLLILIFVWFTNKLDKVNVYRKDDILIWFTLILLLFQLFSFQFKISIRFTYYFAPFSIVLLVNTIDNIKRIDTKFFYTIFWVLLGISELSVVLYYKPEWYSFYPYVFYQQ